MTKKISYLKEVKETNKERQDYQEKIRRHKMSSVYRLLLVAVVILILVAVVYIQYQNHIYTSYELVSTNAFNSIEDSTTMRLGDNILTYSHDGAHCTNAKGEVLWNQTFEMQNILVATCEDMVALADYNGRQIYVLDSTQKISEISTTMPIRNITVAGNGRVAVVAADTKITWIYIYEPDGTLAYEGKTTMGQSGYPVAFSLSPNGELLGQAFAYVDAGVVKSRVAFYNFGAVGSNISDYIVTVDIYPDTIIPYISFLNEDTAVAVGEDRMLVYKGAQKPVLQSQRLIEEEIQAVYHNDSYIGLLLHSDKLDMLNKMDVYQCDSEAKVGTYYFNVDYDDIFFTENYFVAYDNMECIVQTYNGVEKFHGDFLSSTDLLYPIGKGKSYKFVQVSREYINTIQMK